MLGIVITGGCSTGKTSVIKQLEDGGHAVVHETSTMVIQEGKFHPLKDRHSFQMHLLRRQLEVEQTARRKGQQLVYFDRGLLDGIAHYILDGLPIPPDYSALDISHYLAAFIFEDLGSFEENGVRYENLDFIRRFTPVVRSCYENRGIPTIWAPRMSVAERVEFVLQHTARVLEARYRMTSPDRRGGSL